MLLVCILPRYVKLLNDVAPLDAIKTIKMIITRRKQKSFKLGVTIRICILNLGCVGVWV
jgi:hypothetical protein